MRLVIQRVNRASVSVRGDKEALGSIREGLFVLLGIGQQDNESVADKLAEQLVKLRVMPDDQDKMNLSIQDVGGSILVVSQFTLYADTSKGNRPSFIKAADPKKAEKLYEYFVNKLNELGVETQTGSFGEYMLIDVQLDGPVTILTET